MSSFLTSACLMATFLFGAFSASAESQPTPTDDGLLIVAFGTSHEKALTAYRNTEQTLLSHFPEKKMSWAYTSEIIRKKLAKQGKIIPSIQQSLTTLSTQGIKNLRVQSLHMAAGEEFSEMERTVQHYVEHNPGSFEKVFIGRPLLESSRDVKEVIETILSDFSKERQPDEALLLMGHGQSQGRADLVFSAVQTELHKKDPKAFLATVEGSYRFEEALPELLELKKKGLKTIWLAPFMIVAGDHANNDLAGEEEDSWASRLKAEGFEVKVHLKGLGDMKGIQNIFLRHATDTHDDIMSVQKAKN